MRIIISITILIGLAASGYGQYSDYAAVSTEKDSTADRHEIHWDISEFLREWELNIFNMQYKRKIREEGDRSEWRRYSISARGLQIIEDVESSFVDTLTQSRVVDGLYGRYALSLSIGKEKRNNLKHINIYRGWDVGLSASYTDQSYDGNVQTINNQIGDFDLDRSTFRITPSFTYFFGLHKDLTPRLGLSTEMGLRVGMTYSTYSSDLASNVQNSDSDLDSLIISISTIFMRFLNLSYRF